MTARDKLHLLITEVLLDGSTDRTEASDAAITAEQILEAMEADGGWLIQRYRVGKILEVDQRGWEESYVEQLVYTEAD